MSVNGDDKIESAARHAGYAFLSIAKHLGQLQDEDPAALEVVANLLGIDRRDAEFIVRIDRTFSDLGVDQTQRAEIGWAKLVVLRDYVSSSNLHRLLEFAGEMPAKELARLVGRHPDALRRLVLHLTTEQFDIFKEAILAHGGNWSDLVQNRFPGIEEALAKALEPKSF